MMYLVCILGILVCFVIPISGVVILQKKYKRIVKPFIIGILTFSFWQLLLRLPIMHFVLPNCSWYIAMSMNTLAVSLFAGITAGLFEEVGRYVSFRFFLKDNYRAADGIAFGFGHGGIEAVVFVGINAAAILIMTIIGEPEVQQLEAGSLFLGVFERIFAIGSHIGYSMLVLRGFQTGKRFRYLAAAIIVHSLIDSSIGIIPMIVSISPIQMEIVLAVFSVPLILYSIYAYKKPVKYSVNELNS